MNEHARNSLAVSCLAFEITENKLPPSSNEYVLMAAIYLFVSFLA
jgi:hypothetical protein